MFRLLQPGLNMIRKISYSDLNMLAGRCVIGIRDHFNIRTDSTRTLHVYPIPRGGVPATLALLPFGLNLNLVDDPLGADFIMDDLIDTGATAEKFAGYGKPVFALIDKRMWTGGNDWVLWPWEGDAPSSIADHITRLIQYIGDDPTRGGLAETPDRVAAAWKFWGKGYDENPADILKVFEDGAEGVNEMVLVKNIPFYTHCEHHMAPFFGTATVGYIPDGKIVGLSKINRLVDCFARRLQVQERLTGQIADALMEHLQPKGAGVIINARHLCMESRGVCQQGHSTATSALRGVLLDGSPRQEFLMLAN